MLCYAVLYAMIYAILCYDSILYNYTLIKYDSSINDKFNIKFTLLLVVAALFICDLNERRTSVKKNFPKLSFDDVSVLPLN
jgi:hypothetical protein